MRGKHFFLGALVALVLLVGSLGIGQARSLLPDESAGAAFTYQGYLTQNGQPANGAFDFQFRLYDAASEGNQVGNTVSLDDVQVLQGVFTVQLDFGADVFDGQALWLEVAVKDQQSEDYVALTPRQALTATPYAIYSLRAPWSGLVGVPAGFADGVDDDLLSSLSCSSGQIVKWNGSAWVCASDDDTTYTAGTGLVLSGSAFNLAASYQLPQTCANGQIASWDGSQWVCADDQDTTTFWSLTGNAGTDPSTDFIGTTDDQPLVVKVNGQRALRIEPTDSDNAPNIIAGWSGNSVADNVKGATIAGGGGGGYGAGNQVTSNYGMVGGGWGNTASGDLATVGGGSYNTASGEGATVGGGGGNTASGSYSTVGGGGSNTASDNLATVGGGTHNTASGYKATVSGGDSNTASGGWATVAGGTNNVAGGVGAFIGGGDRNTASGDYATVAGGEWNAASGSDATVGGGHHNTASGGYAMVGGGYGNTASGTYATVPGGSGNTAAGDYSFAAGYHARANKSGCFVWGDTNEDTNHLLACNHGDRAIFRTTGGFYIYTSADLSHGVYLPAGGNSWNAVSDRATKENFAPLDKEALLERLAAMPVQQYNLTSQDPSIHHIGPVAQDFYAAFGYGETDRAINMEDAVGVSFAAIQGLYAENQQLKAENAALKAQLDDLNKRVSALEHGGFPSSAASSSLLPGAGVLLLGLALSLRRQRKEG